MRTPRLRQLTRKGSVSQAVVLAAADQVAYAASNFLLSIAVARSATSSEFGAFALAYLLLVGVMGVMKQGLGTTAMLAETQISAGVDQESRSFTFENALFGSLLLGIALGALGVISLILFEPSVWAAVLMAAFPALIADQLRNSAACRLRQGESLVGSLLWAALIGLAVVLNASALVSIGLWALGALVSLLWLTYRLRLFPHVFNARDLGSDDRNSIVTLATDAAANMMYRQVYFWFLALYLGLAAVGTLRAAQTVFSPAAVMTSGMLAGIAPRMRATGTFERRRILRIGASSAVAVAALAVIILLVIIPGLGPALVGDSWQTAKVIVPMILLVRFAEAAILGSQLELVAGGHTRRLATLRIASSIASILIPASGALLAGIEGAAIGMALVSLAFVPIWKRAELRGHG